MYNPRHATEQALFKQLWSIVDQSNTGVITGQVAVEFFKKSGLPIQDLKFIWSLCSSTMNMNEKQFYTYLRYVAMAQNEYFPLTAGDIVRTLLL